MVSSTSEMTETSEESLSSEMKSLVVGGTTALAGALSGLGIPKDTVIEYETQLKANKFLLIASGSAADVEKARGLLAEHNGQLGIHAG